MNLAAQRHNGIAEMAISFLNRRRRIDIGRRAPFSSNGGKINTIDGQFTVLVGKAGHDRPQDVVETSDGR